MSAVSVATGLGWPEGPSVLDDGRVVFVETFKSRVSVFTPGTGVSEYAFTGGGPNATALGADGAVYVTQNGGAIGPFESEKPVQPSIQRISPDGGTVEFVATEVDGYKLRKPNDLAFAPDGRLFFTDPGEFKFWDTTDPGRVFVLNPDGTGELIAEVEPSYPNGIVVEADGNVVWVETLNRKVKRRYLDGRIELICTLPDKHLPDGLTIATNGSLYITVTEMGGVDVVSPDGSKIDFLPVGKLVTNCAFDGSRLYVTDANQHGHDSADHGGVLWAVDVDGVTGEKPFRGSLPVL